jgi:predicted RNA-binding Zn-ribbon protein involved in translation (DUF1610 family)
MSGIEFTDAERASLLERFKCRKCGGGLFVKYGISVTDAGSTSGLLGYECKACGEKIQPCANCSMPLGEFACEDCDE